MKHRGRVPSLGKNENKKKTMILSRKNILWNCEVRISERIEVLKNALCHGGIIIFVHFLLPVYPKSLDQFLTPRTPRRILEKNWRGVTQKSSISEVRIKSKFSFFLRFFGGCGGSKIGRYFWGTPVCNCSHDKNTAVIGYRYNYK